MHRGKHTPRTQMQLPGMCFSLRREALRAVQLFSKNIVSKILAVMVLATPLVAVSGFLYARATGGTLRDSMFHTYTVLQDTPGARPLLPGCCGWRS